MHIALIGPSGVGKGTHARTLSEQYSLTNLVTGELLREHVRERRAVGFLARRYIRRGVLVPDEVVDAMLSEWMWAHQSESGILFDGFPRTISQAEFLDELLAEHGRRLDAAIYLKASPAKIRRRLLGRVVCERCQTPYHLSYHPPSQPGQCDRCGGNLASRPEDIPELIRVRLRAFRRVIVPVLEYYREGNRLIVIDAEGKPEAVRESILEAVESLRLGDIQPVRRNAVVRLEALLREKTPETAPARGRLNVVLVGGPGSGKGTQAERLTAVFGLPHIATGDLFRDNLRRETDLGVLAKSYMDEGALVPNDVTEAMVEERLARTDTDRGFLLDGFPRTLPQAQALAEMMDGLQRELSAVLYIRVSDEEIVRRLSGRLICRDCQTPYHMDFNPPAVEDVCDRCSGELYRRDDDNPRTVRERLKTFHEQTSPIIEFYKRSGLLVEIPGEGTVEQVVEFTTRAIKTLPGA